MPRTTFLTLEFRGSVGGRAERVNGTGSIFGFQYWTYVSYARADEVLRTSHPMHRHPAQILAARLGKTVMTVDHVVAARGDLSEENRVRQVGCKDGCFIAIFAGAVVRDVRKLDELDGEPLRVGADEGQESCCVTLNSKMPFGYNSSPGFAAHGWNGASSVLFSGDGVISPSA